MAGAVVTATFPLGGEALAAASPPGSARRGWELRGGSSGLEMLGSWDARVRARCGA